MKIVKGIIKFSEEEYNRIKRIEDNGEVYFIYETHKKPIALIPRDELEEQIFKNSKKNAIAKHFNVNEKKLNTSLLAYYQEIKLSIIRQQVRN